MPGERAVCYAGNALRPSTLLSRLFNIPLARPRPSFPPHCSIPARSRHNGPNVDTSSLAVTLEALRRSNRASVIRKVGAETTAASTVWFKPELPADRFDPISQQQTSEGQNTTQNGKTVAKRGKKGSWQWSNARSMTVPVHKIGAKEREMPPADYVGQAVEPLYNREDVRDEDLPWFQASQISNGAPLERLRAEIEAFESYLRPTPDERAGRDAVVADTRQVWSRFCSKKGFHTGLEIFGSERSGLAIATSDLDLRVYRPELDEKRDAKQPPRYFARRQFSHVISSALTSYESDPNFMLVFLRHSRYPLLSMQHVGTSLDVQIVCCNDTNKARSVMAKYMEEMPALRKVYILVKYMFEIRGLSDVFRGGIGSYSVFYLVAAAMKLGTEHAKDDAAAQLLAVLEFYSKFDATESWISLDPLEVLSKVENKPVQSKEEKKQLKAHQRIGLQNDEQPYLLCIRDPADRTNDLGRKTFGWKHLQTTMKRLNEELRQDLEKNDGRLLLPALVGRGFDLFEARRQKLAAYGQESPHFVKTQAHEVSSATRQVSEI